MELNDWNGGFFRRKKSNMNKRILIYFWVLKVYSSWVDCFDFFLIFSATMKIDQIIRI